MNTHDPCDPQFTIRYYEKIRAAPSLTRPVPSPRLLQSQILSKLAMEEGHIARFA